MKNISELFDGGTREMQKKKRVTFYTICVTFALLAATLIFLLVTLVAISIGNAKDRNNEDDEPVNIGPTEIITLDNTQIYSGNLLLHRLCDDLSVESGLRLINVTCRKRV